MGQSPTDEELLRRIAAGDTDCFEELYDRYARAAYSLALRIVGDSKGAEDVVQDAFLNVWRRAASFDGARAPAKSWLLGTVHHRAVDVYRRARGKPAVSMELTAAVAGDPDDLWRRVVAAVDGDGLRRALRELPAEQRDVIELAYFGGYSHREISEERGLPLGTVKSRIRMGMEKLRESMKSHRPEL